MSKKKINICIIFFIFILLIIFFSPKETTYKITEVVSPTTFFLQNKEFKLKDLQTFDSYFSSNNKKLAEILSISEEETFIMGNLAKQWAKNFMQGRKVSIKNNDITYQRFSYRTKFLYSGFCIKNGKPCAKPIFENKLKEVRENQFFVLDLDTENFYQISDSKIKTLKNYIMIKKYSKNPTKIIAQNFETKFKLDSIEIFITDHTTKLKPTYNCESNICKEILNNINNAKTSIDMAIYGYSKVPEIETALKNAISRGVKVRLVYDVNPNGENVYPETKQLLKFIAQNSSDINSAESTRLMHNKFYIFDEQTLITGSANLSYTDMSGFNSNSIIVIKSSKIAEIYKKEFEQMFNGKYHTDKKSFAKDSYKAGKTTLNIFFSPQDKTIENAILPLIENAEKYIYIPTFVITETKVVNALLDAKKRGVDIKIIVDALSASGQYSKHQTLRNGGISVKTENYAGKMHSKSMIVDDKYTLIGSMNFSKNGDKRNDENLLLIEDDKIAKFYKDFFLYQWHKIDNKWLKFNARAEGKDSIGSCEDRIDNNYDGLLDSDDLACK